MFLYISIKLSNLFLSVSTLIKYYFISGNDISSLFNKYLNDSPTIKLLLISSISFDIVAENSAIFVFGVI
jgi:hypothetical protein